MVESRYLQTVSGINLLFVQGILGKSLKVSSLKTLSADSLTRICFGILYCDCLCIIICVLTFLYDLSLPFCCFQQAEDKKVNDSNSNSSLLDWESYISPGTSMAAKSLVSGAASLTMMIGGVREKHF